VKNAKGVVTLVVLFLASCGGGSTAPVSPSPITPQPSVAISPGTQQNIDQGQTVKFTAGVSNDTNGQGVSWSVGGTGCSGNGCGTLTNISKAGATYNAPASVASAMNVMVKATSVAKNTASASAMVMVNPPPVISTTSLPGGIVGTSYNTTLHASGGTGALLWSIPAGGLPAGLSLNASTGIISGTPTASGTSTFTVQVIDSAPSPVSATHQFSIIVVNHLIITTTLLPTGTVNVAYSATLQASGGTGPFSWSVTTGSLPAGLSLNAGTGIISGTPTTSEKSTFTVQVADSSTQTATQQLSVTIEPPLTITTTALADGTVNLPYSTTVEAAYATLPMTWSISSGALPTGLNLDASGGNISGTPSVAGTSDFTVMVTDSSTPPQTTTQSLSITISGSGAKNTELSGRYAFLLSGYDNHGNRVAVAGSFVADGAGAITGGMEDVNDTGVAPQSSLTINSGTYTVGTDNRGIVTFTNSAGSTYTMAIAVGNVVGGTAEKGSAVEFDSSGYLMSGVIEWQNSAAFLNAAVAGDYALGFTGSDMAGSRLVVAGQFTANGLGGITGGVFDADDSGTPTASGAIANTSTYTVDTTTGRCSATLSGISPAPSDYVFYIVSASKLLALSIDTASTSGLVTGEIDAQTGGPYSNSSLSATVVMGVDTATASGSFVTLGAVTFDGSGNASFSMDENNAGTLTTVTGIGTYTAPDAATGRFTLTPPQGMPSLVGYLVSVNQAFVLGADSGVTVGTFEPQSAGPFTISSLNFAGFFGDQAFATAPVPPPYGVLPATLSTGAATFDGSGNITTTSDKNMQGTLLSAQPSSTTYLVSSNGRVTLGSGSAVLYIVSPTKFATMSTVPNDPNPTLGFGRQ
jgi:Putative Ig domain